MGHAHCTRTTSSREGGTYIDQKRMPTATSKTALKWLNRCQELLDEWTEYHSMSERLWRSLATLEGQMEMAVSFAGSLQGAPCGDTEWRNPYTTHPLILALPSLPQRLLKRQMDTRERILRQLSQAVSSIHSGALKGLKVLTKDVLAKRSTQSLLAKEKYGTVADISLLEAADWIDALSSACSNEWAIHQGLLDTYIHCLATSEQVLDRWSSQDLYDSRIEVEMRDRMKLCRALSDKIQSV